MRWFFLTVQIFIPLFSLLYEAASIVSLMTNAPLRRSLWRSFSYARARNLYIIILIESISYRLMNQYWDCTLRVCFFYFTFFYYFVNLAWSSWYYNALLRNLYKNIVWSCRVQYVEPRQRSIEIERKREREEGREVGRAELGERETYGGRRQIEGYTFIMDNWELVKKRES